MTPLDGLETRADLDRWLKERLTNGVGLTTVQGVRGLVDQLAELQRPWLSVTQTAAPADADIATSELTIWFDDTSGAAKVMFKGKDSGGTVRTGEVALT